MGKQKKQEDPPAGSPAWMATFSDLMNLLLCFFVLLFSMSSVDAEKFELVIASLQSHFSILQGGGSSIGSGEMVGAGINQLQYYDTFYNPNANSSGKGEFEEDGNYMLEDDSVIEKHDPEEGNTLGDTSEDLDSTSGAGELSTEELLEKYQETGLRESEQMAGLVEDMAKEYGIQNQVEVNFNSQYVMITLSGAVLFDSASETIKEESLPLVDKLGRILSHYPDNIIEIEGHSDNLPIHNERFADNNVLSMHRALSVADYIRANTSLDPSHIKSSGRGDYVPIADNSTAEGRALNRRVVIKIYNSFSQKD